MQMWPMITKERELCYTISFYLPSKQNSVMWKLDQPKTDATLSFLVIFHKVIILIWLCLHGI